MEHFAALATSQASAQTVLLHLKYVIRQFPRGAGDHSERQWETEITFTVVFSHTRVRLDKGFEERGPELVPDLNRVPLTVFNISAGGGNLKVFGANKLHL